MRPGLRRRRKIHRSTSMAGDPLDLFQHAMTNARGVIMFVMLMMALFGQASDAVVQVTVGVLEAAERLKALQDERDALQRKVAALPPMGDPELSARYLAAIERLRRLEPDANQARVRLAADEAELARMREATEATRRERDRIEAARPRDPAARPPSSFVRISRFQQDPRKSVIIAIAGGMASRIRATAGTEVIQAPATGRPITGADDARKAAAELLVGFPSATHLVVLLVWEGSFLQAKLFEQALLDAGYDSNPIPVASGESVKPGAGGVQ
jgi:hypothetical protein